MADSIDSRLIDKRVSHRYVRKGVLDEKEFERHMKSLPDLADRAMPIEASMDGDEVDDLDDEDDVEADEK